MSLILTKGVKSDLIEAARWYADQREGLDVQFAVAVELTLRRIEDTPAAYAICYGRFRKVRVDRFPYSIIYEIRNDDIVVHAAIHLRRGPEQIARQLKRPE